MIRLYAAPRTRAVRILWLLEELGLPYELELVDFQPTTSSFFIQTTPTGKIPTLVDGDLTMCESGAIIEYLLETHGGTRLAPELGSAERGRYLQWLHYAESTAFPPLGIVIWLTVYRDDEAEHPALIEDAKNRARSAFRYIEEEIGDATYLVGDEFTAADIMMGFTLFAAASVGVLDESPKLQAYLARITDRDAFRRTLLKLPL
jgi:glutathione S-transferase